MGKLDLKAKKLKTVKMKEGP